MSNPTEQQSHEQGEQERIALLVEKAQQGDMNAFEDIVRTFQGPIFNLAYRMVNNRDDAADAAQEIFVKLFRKIRQFRGNSKFSTWLFSLAANTCRSRLRRLRRIASFEVRHVDEEYETDEGSRSMDLADPADDPVRTLERTEMQHGIESAITELPPDARMIVVLRDLQGLSYEEIAGVLHCSIGTVKSRLCRARSRLKETLMRRGFKCNVRK